MEYYGDYHTHTKYSDGKGTIEQNIAAAVERGLKEIAITDHGFRNPVCLKTRDLEKQAEEIELCRKKYPDIRILHGIEADLMNREGDIDLGEDLNLGLDLVIAGYHPFAVPYSAKALLHIQLNTYFSAAFKPSKKTVVKNTDTAIKMLEKNKIDIYPHINHMFTVDIKALAEACESLGVFIELNMKHLNPALLDCLFSTSALFIADTDAHSPERVGDFSAIEPFISRGIDFDRIVNAGGKKPKFRRSLS